MYIKCFEEGCFSPTLIFDEIMLMPKQLEISLKINNETLTWQNKHSFICKTDFITGEILGWEQSGLDYYGQNIGFEIDIDKNDVEFNAF